MNKREILVNVLLSAGKEVGSKRTQEEAILFVNKLSNYEVDQILAELRFYVKKNKMQPQL